RAARRAGRRRGRWAPPRAAAAAASARGRAAARGRGCAAARAWRSRRAGTRARPWTARTRPAAARRGAGGRGRRAGRSGRPGPAAAGRAARRSRRSRRRCRAGGRGGGPIRPSPGAGHAVSGGSLSSVVLLFGQLLFEEGPIGGAVWQGEAGVGALPCTAVGAATGVLLVVGGVGFAAGVVDRLALPAVPLVGGACAARLGAHRARSSHAAGSTGSRARASNQAVPQEPSARSV